MQLPFDAIDWCAIYKKDALQKVKLNCGRLKFGKTLNGLLLMYNYMVLILLLVIYARSVIKNPKLIHLFGDSKIDDAF